MRRNVTAIHGNDFIELENGTIKVQLHSALRLIASNEDHFTDLMADFLHFSKATDHVSETLVQ